MHTANNVIMNANNFIFLIRLVCRKFIQNKSTGDSSAFPFICGFLSWGAFFDLNLVSLFRHLIGKCVFCLINFENRCSLWLKYGILANETTVVFVNCVGSTLYFSYFIVFWMFTVNTGPIYRQFFGALLVLGLTLSYTDYYEIDRSEAVEIVGECCAWNFDESFRISWFY